MRYKERSIDTYIHILLFFLIRTIFYLNLFFSECNLLTLYAINMMYWDFRMYIILNYYFILYIYDYII